MANRLDPNTRADTQIVGTIDDLDPSWSVMNNGAFKFWGQGGESLTVNLHSDLPDPSTVLSGTIMIVANDPNESLNGEHIAGGTDAGLPALSWTNS